MKSDERATRHVPHLNRIAVSGSLPRHEIPGIQWCKVLRESAGGPQGPVAESGQYHMPHSLDKPPGRHRAGSPL